MRHADEAMYAAKGKGKNGFQVYRPGKAAWEGGYEDAPEGAPHLAAPAGDA